MEVLGIWNAFSSLAGYDNNDLMSKPEISLFNYHYSSCLELLVTGYVSSNHKQFVPSDIAYLIANYFKNYDEFIDINSYFLCTGNKASRTYNKTNILFNVATNKSYCCEIKNISASTTSLPKNQYPVSNANGKCIIKSSPLPHISFKHLLSVNDNNRLQNKNFTMIANIGNSGCDLTAFHASSFLQPSSYVTALRFELPPISSTIIKNPSVIYSEINRKLYVITPKNTNRYSFWYHNQSIFSLDFKCKNNNNWKWIEECNNLKYIRSKTSSCFIHNDKFIAIIGGSQELSSKEDVFFHSNQEYSKKLELYSVDTKHSIPLSNLNKNRMNAPCLYNDKLYNIIIAGSDVNGKFDGIEMYDINKDVWTCPKLSEICNCPKLYGLASDYQGIAPNHSQNLYISPLNSKILFYSGISNLNKNNRPVMIRIDLRDNTIMTVNIPHVWFSDDNCFLSNLPF